MVCVCVCVVCAYNPLTRTSSLRSHKTNPLAQEYVLPDYSQASRSASSTTQPDAARYGFLKRGPGSASALESARQQNAKRRRGDATHEVAVASAAIPEDSADEEASFVDVSLIAPQTTSLSDDDDDDGSDSDSPSEPRAPRANKDQGDAQTLLLAQERFQIPEVLFAPSTIGTQFLLLLLALWSRANHLPAFQQA